MTKARLLEMLLGIFIVFLLGCGAIMIDGLHDRSHAADLAVILGNKVNPDGQPSEQLRVRLDHAIRLYKDGYFKTILVSGGTGHEGFSEPDVMRRYLIHAEIPSSAIFRDQDGIDTFHTARNTAQFLKEHHLHSVLIISQYFHMTRCRLAFGRFGIDPIYTSHAPFFSWRDFYSVPREVAGCMDYFFRSYLGTQSSKASGLSQASSH